MSVRFFVGLHQPSDAQHFDLCCISINRVRGRKKPVDCVEVIIDSAAFTELNLHGGYRHGVEEYAAELYRLHMTAVVKIIAAVAQDYMCEAFMLEKTKAAGASDGTVADHQRLTIERYDALKAEVDRLFNGGCPFPIMPVLQGYSPADYVRHVRMYGDRLTPGMWVGVGSVCKRNGDPIAIVNVLSAIHSVRPDLLLHGFGIKQTSLEHAGVRELLYSADSMAWSFAARRQGRNGNSWQEAKSFAVRVQAAASKALEAWQMPLPLWRIAA
ncbi:hypothetical protein FJ981_27850 [Mesorhizobium sp. B1-1-4]|uniref:deazapurine DNA modification protein DpdA family protein n=1 Tax=Mesorhizobium sp. B1-1-4 TaxID=2589980 RepID=UPI0011261A8E|nr:hypothetical protein [Mesorhizobium sp. B1-1-4]TPN44414.1 hypothetical protein FJ981_27850 [Mesorhizobium sp. B1-1-4]